MTFWLSDLQCSKSNTWGRVYLQERLVQRDRNKLRKRIEGQGRSVQLEQVSTLLVVFPSRSLTDALYSHTAVWFAPIGTSG